MRGHGKGRARTGVKRHQRKERVKGEDEERQKREGSKRRKVRKEEEHREDRDKEGRGKEGEAGRWGWEVIPAGPSHTRRRGRGRLGHRRRGEEPNRIKGVGEGRSTKVKRVGVGCESSLASGPSLARGHLKTRAKG